MLGLLNTMCSKLIKILMNFLSMIFCQFIFDEFCSTDIQSVVEKEKEKASVNGDVLCTACEMAVVWIENQLRKNQTKERILAYVNQVYLLDY